MAWSATEAGGFGSSASATSHTLTTTANLPSGQLAIIGGVFSGGNTLSSVNDQNANSWTAINRNNGGSNEVAFLAYCVPSTTVASGTGIVLTPSATAYAAAGAVTFSGNAASPFDVQNGGGSSTLTTVIASVTTAAIAEDGEMRMQVVGYSTAAGAVFQAGTNENLLTAQASTGTVRKLGWEWKTAGSAGGTESSDGSFSANANNHAVIVATFKSGGIPPQTVRPDGDLATTGWATAPLYSKINDSSDATVISATLA